MIDTHAHLLPGLDDGSPDVDSSLRMAEAAVAAGVTMLVCTPHLRELDAAFVSHTREVLQGFRSTLAARGIALELLGGFEIDVTVAATASLDELAPLALESSRGLLLVEMPHWGWPVRLTETLFRLRTLGLTPLLAHPERNDRIQRNPALLRDCIDSGAVIQATASSLDGSFGRASRAAFSKHLSAGQVAVLASDAHFHRRSSWTVSDAIDSLRRRLTAEEIDILVRVNPGRLLRGESPLPVAPARRTPWSGLMGGF